MKYIPKYGTYDGEIMNLSETLNSLEYTKKI